MSLSGFGRQSKVISNGFAGHPMGTAAALSTYSRCVFEPGDIIEIRRLPSKKSTWCVADELPSQAADLLDANNGGENLFVGINPRRGYGGRTARDVALARCLLADLDGATVDEALSRWDRAGLPALTLTVDSGHGVHLYLRLAEPVEDLQKWTLYQKRLIEAVGSDPRIHDAPRIIRIPGTVNHKPPARSCRIVRADPKLTYTINDLLHVLPDSASVTSVSQVSLSILPFSQDPTQHIACVPVCVPKWADAAITRTLPTGPGQRNRKVFDLAMALKRAKPESTPDLLRQILKKWHLLALPVIQTKPFDATWQDFITAWKRITNPTGISLRDILADTEEMPLPTAARQYDTAVMQRLVAICAGLQQAWGDDPFFLSARMTGDALGVSRMAAWRMIQTLLFDRVLELVNKGRYKEKTANEYKFKG